MRLLLVADAGDGLLDLALIAQRAGHQTKLFVRKFHPQTRPVGKGLVELVPDWHPWIQWADLTILEGNGFAMHEFAAWQRRGCRIIGGTPDSASWELAREAGMKVFQKAGIPVPEFRVFHDYDSAIRYVEGRGAVMYSKPCSDTADKSLSAKTGIPEQPAWMLRKWKQKHGRPPCPFLLQAGIDGVEFAVGAWFGPSGFADAGFEENFEHKKLFAGDLGPNCGEAGTVLRYVRRSKLAEQVLLPLEEQLAAINYCGNIDVNCIIDPDGTPWPLEHTVRLGWPAFNIECALLDEPVEFLAALAAGESTRGYHRMNEVAVGVVMALPPYPSPPRAYEEIVGVPLYGELDGWHPCEMMARDHRFPHHDRPDHLLVSAGGYLGVATGTGATVRQAARTAYKVLDGLSMPASPFWRNDIGERMRRDIPALQEHGYAAGFEH